MKKKPTPSAIFWNSMLFLVLLIFLFINWRLFATGIGILSVLTIGIMFDGNDDPDNIWIWITPTFWVLAGLAVICLGLHWLYTKTIGKFNNYLNNKFENNRILKDGIDRERKRLLDLDCKLADEFEKITNKYGENQDTERLQERQKEIRKRLDEIGWN